MAKRCSHCGTDVTPQWHRGPPDKPDLCNACRLWYRSHKSFEGYVPKRFKSGLDEKGGPSKQQKKQKDQPKNPTEEANEGNKQKEPIGEKKMPKRCSQCGTDETPQWRRGPPDKPDLCNACNMWYRSHKSFEGYVPKRFKSGLDEKGGPSKQQKKQKDQPKNPTEEANEGNKQKEPIGEKEIPTRCSQCGTDETSKWCRGPPPDKAVLCNACKMWHRNHGSFEGYVPRKWFS